VHNKGFQGFNPASSVPNYSVMGGAAVNNQQTFRQKQELRNPQSILSNGTYQMFETRIPNR